MHAIIVLGGERITSLCAPLPEKALVIAADRGWDNALALGLMPDVLVGDMDSISAVPDGVELHRSPAVKDETDAQLAIRCAVSRGADSLTLVGRIAGRADHTLSLIFLLESLKKHGIAAEIVDDINRIRLLSKEAFALRRAGFKYFGLLSLGRSTVSASSCKYPLERSELVRDNPYATSNEITGDAAYIEVSGDGVLLIESDRLA